MVFFCNKIYFAKKNKKIDDAVIKAQKFYIVFIYVV